MTHKQEQATQLLPFKQLSVRRLHRGKTVKEQTRCVIEVCSFTERTAQVAHHCSCSYTTQPQRLVREPRNTSHVIALYCCTVCRKTCAGSKSEPAASFLRHSLEHTFQCANNLHSWLQLQCKYQCHLKLLMQYAARQKASDTVLGQLDDTRKRTAPRTPTTNSGHQNMMHGLLAHRKRASIE